MNAVDRLLNQHTMYSFVLRGLWVLVGISFLEATLRWLPYTPVQLFFSLALLLGVTAATNAACALITGAVSSRESTRITALMLYFALSAPQSASDALILMLAASVAMLSKYLFSTRKLHVCNPSAFSLLIISIAVPAIVTWWVGTLVLFPFVLLFGILVVRKMHSADVVWPFTAAVALVLGGQAFLAGQTFSAVYIHLITATPFLFVGLLMLSDPHSMPKTPYTGVRALYGAVVGALYPLTFSWWGITGSPQLALVGGNIWAFSADAVTRVRNRLDLSLQKAKRFSRDTFEFALVPSVLSTFQTGPSLPTVLDAKPLAFAPGQSIEITLPHKKADYRGIRRTFVLTSAPEDHYLMFCTTIPVECSSFKETLHTLQLSLLEKDVSLKKLSLSATGPLGSALFPQDPNQKVLCLASGIGIASFMSYFRQLAHNNERRDMVLLYSATSPLDFIYKEELDAFAARIGLKILYVPLDFIELAGKWEGLSGAITPPLIKKNIPDYASRVWLMAGPTQNTKEYKKIARQLSVPAEAVKIQDYPGF